MWIQVRKCKQGLGFCTKALFVGTFGLTLQPIQAGRCMQTVHAPCLCPALVAVTDHGMRFSCREQLFTALNPIGVMGDKVAHQSASSSSVQSGG